MNQRVLAPLVLLAFGAPDVALAEVSDKMGDPARDWVWAAPLAAILFLTARQRRVFCIVSAVFPAFLLIASIDLTIDPYVGKALWAEQGWRYFAHIWGVTLLLVVAVAGGFVLRAWGSSPAA